MRRRRFVRLTPAGELLRGCGGALIGGLAGGVGGALGGLVGGTIAEEFAPGLDPLKAAVLFRAVGAVGGLSGWLAGRIAAEETAPRDLHRIEAGSISADLFGLTAFRDKLGAGFGLGCGAAVASYLRHSGQLLGWAAGWKVAGVTGGSLGGSLAGAFAGALAWLFAGALLGDPPLETLAAESQARDRRDEPAVSPPAGPGPETS